MFLRGGGIEKRRVEFLGRKCGGILYWILLGLE